MDMSLSVFSTIPTIHSSPISAVTRPSAVPKCLTRNFSLRAVPLSSLSADECGGLFGEVDEIEDLGMDEFEDVEDFPVDLEKLEKEAEDVAMEYSRALLSQLTIG